MNAEHPGFFTFKNSYVNEEVATEEVLLEEDEEDILEGTTIAYWDMIGNKT